MKYVITGGAGNTSRPIVLSLLDAGQEVKVIGRNEKNLIPLVEHGAEAAIGSVDDLEFLKKSFTGADAVYTLVPPNFRVADWRGYIGQVGTNYFHAIKSCGIKHVVNLSSVGGHMSQGAGPVSGLHDVEETLNQLADVNILHLRAGYFYENLFGSLAMIKNKDILGSNYGADLKMVLVSPADIADLATQELLQLNFKGHTVRYICSDERTTTEIVQVLGKAVGKPDLPWVEFTDEQSLSAMLQAGLSQEIAQNYIQMGSALRSGRMAEDYWTHHPDHLGQTKLEDFAKKFAAAYENNLNVQH